MGKIRVRVLDEKEIKAIHDGTMQILRDTGVMVHHEEALELLAALTGADTFGHCGICGTDHAGSVLWRYLDNEATEYVKRIARGFEVDSEKVATDLVNKIGPGLDQAKLGRLAKRRRTIHGQSDQRAGQRDSDGSRARCTE